MKKLLLFFLLLSSVNAFAQKLLVKKGQRVFVLPANIKKTDYVPNTIIIKYKGIKPVLSTQLNGQEKSNNSPVLKLNNISSFTHKFPIVDAFQSELKTQGSNIPSSVSNTLDLSSIYELKYSDSRSIEDVINELLQDPNVEYAEPSYISHIQYTPNDQYFKSGEQNYLAQVSAPQAWDINRSSNTVVIAIVDSGSDINHIDLKDNIYININDPINGIDDDHDGYIDNYFGWDLAGSTESVIQPDNDPNVKSANASHGVHVSGLASAVSDNNTGVASIAFNAKLMIVKAAADDAPNSVSLGYEGIKYAVDHGAKVINCSWGSSAGGSFGQDIINYALSKDCLIVAAAGNNGTSAPVYPAAYSGVLAVANVNENDVVSGSSSFGNYVGISAPGTDILSTIYPGTYGINTGTSMSAPIVSSAAALVKANFPGLTMQQVGEKLRVTTDYIDDKNQPKAGLLGKGRLNVLKALTVNLPSIRKQNLVTNTTSTNQGDIIEIYIDLKNFLDATNDLTIKLTSPNPFVKIISGETYVGSVATSETRKMVGPFKVEVSASAPSNSLAQFKLTYTANSYNDNEGFSIPTGLDYINVRVNDVATSITSNGRVGYSSADANNGLGFIYKDQNLMYEASLMIGNAPNAVSNNARNGNGSDEHFVKKIKAKHLSGSLADFEGISEFDDSASPNPLNLSVKHKQIAYTKAPDNKYVIAEYEITNKSSAQLNNLFIGLFTDWDIDENGSDATNYDAFNKLAYTYGTKTGSKYAGVKLLTNNAAPLYYPLSTSLSDNPLYDGFTINKKYLTLSNGVKASGIGVNGKGYDVSFVSGYGPFKIAPNTSVKVAFAFIAGDDLNDLEKSATAAEIKYLSLEPDNIAANQVILNQNYPNPVKDNTVIQFSIPNQGLTTLDIFDIYGRKMQTLLNSNLQSGTHSVKMESNNLVPGIYVYKLHFAAVDKALKMIVVK